MDSEGDVLEHHQAVGNSNTGQYEVDGVGPHVLVGEYNDVEHVEDSPHRADHQGKIAMERKVSILQQEEVVLYEVYHVLP